MFIQTERTPNPETLKFIPPEPVTGEGAVEFKGEEEAKDSPLAKRLFEIESVGSVFLGADFISVTKSGEETWDSLSVRVIEVIRDHYLSGLPAVRETGGEDSGESRSTDDNDDEIVSRIKELLEERVRPALAADGGDVVFSGFENGIVYLKMQGACSGCPGAMHTLKAGIENLLKHFIPEVESVEPAP